LCNFIRRESCSTKKKKKNEQQLGRHFGTGRVGGGGGRKGQGTWAGQATSASGRSGELKTRAVQSPTEQFRDMAVGRSV